MFLVRTHPDRGTAGFTNSTPMTIQTESQLKQSDLDVQAWPIVAFATSLGCVLPQLLFFAVALAYSFGNPRLAY